MRVIVCGGRDYENRGFVRRILAQYLSPGDTLIHGAARGADTIASEVCPCFVNIHAFPADWKKYGKSAGPRRNQQMLEEGPDLVIAFPGGKGTAHMVNIARKARVKVLDLREPLKEKQDAHT